MKNKKYNEINSFSQTNDENTFQKRFQIDLKSKRWLWKIGLFCCLARTCRQRNLETPWFDLQQNHK